MPLIVMRKQCCAESTDNRNVAIRLQVALRSDTSWGWAGWGLSFQSREADQLPVFKHR